MNLAADIDIRTYPDTKWLLQDIQGKAVRKGEIGEIGVVEQNGPYPTGKPFMTNEYAHAEASRVPRHDPLPSQNSGGLGRERTPRGCNPAFCASPNYANIGSLPIRNHAGCLHQAG